MLVGIVITSLAVHTAGDLSEDITAAKRGIRSTKQLPQITATQRWPKGHHPADMMAEFVQRTVIPVTQIDASLRQDLPIALPPHPCDLPQSLLAHTRDT